LDRWSQLAEEIRVRLPHLSSFLGDEQGFLEIRLKSRDDGTILGIAKGYNHEGMPIVCFGVGYDAVLALMALDATIQGDGWREDKPWKPPKS
jgi:hypothetical protein